MRCISSIAIEVFSNFISIVDPPSFQNQPLLSLPVFLPPSSGPRSTHVLCNCYIPLVIREHFTTCAILLAVLIQQSPVYFVPASAAACDFSVVEGKSLFNFSLSHPISSHPHGVLSEDGFYKVASNETLLRFQLCDQMIFNHEPPRCFGCQDCGGPSHCGAKCSALVAIYEKGYPVCKTIGHASQSQISLIDEKNPRGGVIVKMSATHLQQTCSLSVSGPYLLDKSGACDYATFVRHPCGCPTIISLRGHGWGWFGTFITVLLCLFGGYILAGCIYRYFFLGIRGIEVVPNLEFLISLPQCSRSLFESLVRRFKRHPRGSRSTYSSFNF